MKKELKFETADFLQPKEINENGLVEEIADEYDQIQEAYDQKLRDYVEVEEDPQLVCDPDKEYEPVNTEPELEDVPKVMREAALFIKETLESLPMDKPVKRALSHIKEVIVCIERM